MTWLLTILTSVYKLFVGWQSTAGAFGIDFNKVWGTLRFALMVFAAACAVSRLGPFLSTLLVTGVEFARRYMKDYTADA